MSARPPVLGRAQMARGRALELLEKEKIQGEAGDEGRRYFMSEKQIEKGEKKPQGSAIRRREFLKKGAAAAALLPYVAPVVTTFLLGANDAEAQEVTPKGKKEKKPKKPPPGLSPEGKGRAQNTLAAMAEAAKA